MTQHCILQHTPKMELNKAEEDDIIAQALQILDKRHFTREAVLESPNAVISYLKLKLSPKDNEIFAAVFLDTKHSAICYEELFTGTLDSASVYPREIVKRALHHNAGALIIVHNHPSGNPEPSTADRTLTKRIKEVLALVGVTVLDHFIVGAGRPYSFLENGLL